MRFNEVILTNHLAMPLSLWDLPRPLLPPPPPPEGDLGRVLAEPPQLQKSFLLLGLSFSSSRSGSLAVSCGSSDIPEQALSYTAQPWPPGPLPGKDSPGRTFLPGVFLPFLENVKQRNGIQKKSISSDGGELCMYSKSIWAKFTEHLLWVGPAALEGTGFNQPPLGHGDDHGQEGRGGKAGISNSYLS